jgi:lipoyl-dependent peroxiredoxin subunit D
MEFLAALKSSIPDYAKDIRLNLDAVLMRSSLERADALGAALAAAYAARSAVLVDTIRGSGELSETDANAALSAAALMGMNNVWYPYVEMANDEDLRTQRAELRMNAYATHGGVDKVRFELFSLAASIVGKCHFCVLSHYRLLKEHGMSAQQLRDVGRISAVIAAAANVMAVEGGAAARVERTVR